MIVARWENEDRTKAAVLSTEGTLSLMERAHPSDVWSPPIKLDLKSAISYILRPEAVKNGG